MIVRGVEVPDKEPAPAGSPDLFDGGQVTAPLRCQVLHRGPSVDVGHVQHPGRALRRDGNPHGGHPERSARNPPGLLEGEPRVHSAAAGVVGGIRHAFRQERGQAFRSQALLEGPGMLLDGKHIDPVLPDQADNHAGIGLAELRIDAHDPDLHGWSAAGHRSAVAEREQPEGHAGQQRQADSGMPAVPAEQGKQEGGHGRRRQPRGEGKQLDHAQRPRGGDGAKNGQARQRHHEDEPEPCVSHTRAQCRPKPCRIGHVPESRHRAAAVQQGCAEGVCAGRVPEWR